MKKAKRIVLWFRQDLRLHDNEALTSALQRGEEVVPVYVFDERLMFGETGFGLRKMAAHRARFLIESVTDLRQSLRLMGIDLIVRIGKPEEEIFAIARQIHSSCIFANMERADEEVQVQDALERNLWSIGQEIHFFRGKMLYYTQDLPFPISQTPDNFGTFRKEVERVVPVREPLPMPEHLPAWTFSIDTGDIPSLDVFHPCMPEKPDTRAAFVFEGGESKALQRMQHYVWGNQTLGHYEEKRNDLLSADSSSKLSPWLALGCLSPKLLYKEIKAFEQKYNERKSTHALFLELLRRDFYRLMGKKYSSKVFQRGGVLGNETKQLSDDKGKFLDWVFSKTGLPFIDANMTELRSTGYISHRGRQNVASYLVNEMGVNWQLGAEYFESILIDYDVFSNWVNWLHIGGVGCDSRDEHHFHVVSQAKRYDPKGEYVKRWLPNLSNVSADNIHELMVNG